MAITRATTTTTFDLKLIDQIDAAAKQLGLPRSRFLEQAAIKMIKEQGLGAE